MDCSPPSSSVHGIFQARTQCIAISSSRGSFQPRDQTTSFALAGRFFNIKPPREPLPGPWEFCIPQNNRYSPWPNQQPHKIDFWILILWDHYFITHTCCWRSKKEKTQTLHTSEVRQIINSSSRTNLLHHMLL